jgi:tetratricopeptide (TPR) repeat protein
VSQKVISAICLCITIILASHRPSDAQQLLTWRDEGSDRAIVFVHGIGGDALGTFKADTQPPVFWHDLLASDADPISSGHRMSDYDLYAVDYSYAFAKITSVTIDEVAAQVFDYLKGRGLFQRYNHIFFITHSLGGLITKRGINITFNRGEFGYVDKITAVLLLGVPSQGAPIADLGSNQYAFFIARTFGVAGSNQKLIKDMQSGAAETNSYLNSTENDWKRFVEQEKKISSGFPKVFCAYETNAIGIAPIIVPKLYASTTCDGDIQPIAKDHFSLVKPESRADPVYIWARSRIDDAAKALKESHAVFYTIEGANGTELKAIVRMAGTSKAFQRDDATDRGVIGEKVEIDKAHDPSGRYVVFNQAYGATWADVFERIAGLDHCILTDISKDRKSIRLSLREDKDCPVNDKTEDQSLIDLLEQGDQFAKQKQFAEAIDAYTKSIDRRSNFEPSYVARAQVQAKLKDYGGALKDFDKAIALNPNDVDALIDRAGVQTELVQYEKALADYGYALNLDPKNNRALYNRSRLYAQRKEYDNAIEDLDLSISIDPTRPLDWNNRCYIQLLKGELARALPDCNRSIAIKGNDATSFDTRGLVFLKMGRLDEALADYNAALKLNPLLPESLYGRSIVKREKKNSRGSEQDRKAALKLKPEIVSDFQQLGL